MLLLFCSILHAVFSSQTLSFHLLFLNLLVGSLWVVGVPHRKHFNLAFYFTVQLNTPTCTCFFNFIFIYQLRPHKVCTRYNKQIIKTNKTKRPGEPTQHLQPISQLVSYMQQYTCIIYVYIYIYIYIYSCLQKF